MKTVMYSGGGKASHVYGLMGCRVLFGILEVPSFIHLGMRWSWLGIDSYMYD